MGSKYSCSFSGCTKAYSKPSLLEEHENTHANVRPFACSECPKAYFKKKDLKVHEERKHKQTEKTQICPVCSKAFYTPHELGRHTESCTRKHKCIFCLKVFVRNAPYLKHLLRCNAPSGHTVPGDAVPRKDALGPDASISNPKIPHTNPLKCPECAKTYSKPFNMRAHFRAVHERLRHVCARCDASFAHPHTLRKHMRKCSTEAADGEKEADLGCSLPGLLL